MAHTPQRAVYLENDRMFWRKSAEALSLKEKKGEEDTGRLLTPACQ